MLTHFCSRLSLLFIHTHTHTDTHTYTQLTPHTLGPAGPDRGHSGDELTLQDPDRVGPESVVSSEPSIRARRSPTPCGCGCGRRGGQWLSTLPLGARE